MPTYEEMLRQQMGMPIQQGAQQIGQMADQGVMAAQQKLQALQQIAGNQPQALPPSPTQVSIPPEALPNSPSMKPADALSRTQAMIQAPLDREKLDAHFKAQADADAAEDARRAHEASEFDPSAYQDYKPKNGRYQKIQKTLSGEDEE